MVNPMLVQRIVPLMPWLFEDALSHVSEMNTDEAELLPDDTNT